MNSPFQRTTCGCTECVKCCKRQPGPLAPGDLERIAAFLGETPEQARRHFWASPGALIKQFTSVGTFTSRVGTITPRYRKGRCVFLDENDRCMIHPVAPFGCAYFDTHQPQHIAMERSVWLVNQQMNNAEYQRLRDQLPYATHHQPIKYL